MGTRDAHDFEFNDVPGADVFDTLAKGPVGWARTTSSTGTFTAETTLAALTIDDVPLQAGRRYLVIASLHFESTVALDIVRVRVKKDGNPIMVENWLIIAASLPTSTPIMFTFTPSAGASQFTVTAERQTGTGNLKLEASSNTPSELLIFDIGSGS